MSDAHRILTRRLYAYFDTQKLCPQLCSSRSERWASATFAGARHQFDFALDATCEDTRARLARLGATIGEAEFSLPGHILADIGYLPSHDAATRFTIEALTVEAA